MLTQDLDSKTKNWRLSHLFAIDSFDFTPNLRSRLMTQLNLRPKLKSQIVLVCNVQGKNGSEKNAPSLSACELRGQIWYEEQAKIEFWEVIFCGHSLISVQGRLNVQLTMLFFEFTQIYWGKTNETGSTACSSVSISCPNGFFRTFCPSMSKTALMWFRQYPIYGNHTKKWGLTRRPTRKMKHEFFRFSNKNYSNSY